MKKKLIYSTVISSCLAAPVSAEQSHSETLEAIVVTASGAVQDLKDAPASVTVINQQSLRNRPVTDLTDALQDVPGVNLGGSSANTQDISIRGLPADYTLIMVDGRRQNTRESRPNGNGGFEGGFIPPIGAIERIEVVRGPMSSLYGSDAMGGVVNIITKGISENWTGSLSSGGILHDDGKSGNGYNGNFFLSGPLIARKLGIQLYGSGDYRQEDEFVGGLNKKENKNINSKLVFTPTDKQKFTLEAGRNIQQKAQHPGKSLAATTNRAGVITQNTASETIASRNHWALSHYGDWGVMTSEFSLYQEKAKRQIKMPSGYNSRQPEITNTVFDAKFMLPVNRHFFVFGGQYQHAELHDDSVVSVIRSGNRSTARFQTSTNKAIQKALFAEDEITLTDNLLLTLGARLDHHQTYGSHWNPRTYLVYHLNRAFTLKGGVAKAFKAPGIRESSAGYVTSTQNGAGVIYGNPNLKPETSVNQEIGFSYAHLSGLNVALTLFNTDFKNKLTSYGLGVTDPITGANLYEYSNIGKANIKGIEFTAHLPFNPQWSLDLSYTYQHSKRKTDEDRAASGQSLQGYPLNNTPKHAATAKLNWQLHENLDAYARWHYQGSQIWANPRNGDSKNIARYRAAYNTLDIGVNYQLSKNMLLNFAVLNIGNERAGSINTDGGNWLSEDGRRYWANATLTF